MKEGLPIPWIKEEDFEFISGTILLATNIYLEGLPVIVRVLGNGKVEEIHNPEHPPYPTSAFDFYADLTVPPFEKKHFERAEGKRFYD